MLPTMCPSPRRPSAQRNALRARQDLEADGLSSSQSLSILLQHYLHKLDNLVARLTCKGPLTCVAEVTEELLSATLLIESVGEVHCLTLLLAQQNRAVVDLFWELMPIVALAQLGGEKCRQQTSARLEALRNPPEPAGHSVKEVSLLPGPTSRCSLRLLRLGLDTVVGSSWPRQQGL